MMSSLTNDIIVLYLFEGVSIATEALELANGYHMYDKPLIISYGKKGHGMDTS